MQGLKVPGLNFELFSKNNAKEQPPEPPPAAVEAASEPDRVSVDVGRAPSSEAVTSVPNSTQEQDSNVDVNETLAEHELLWSTQYTYDEFIDSLTVSHEGRGDTPSEKRHWSYPRRWLVKVQNLKIINCVADALTCFAEFDFGGSRSECRVQMGASVCIMNRGETKNYIRTPVVQNVTKDVTRSFNCTQDFEYRGSYLDLENEKLKIKLWKYRRYTVNSLESIYEGPLLQFAKGDIHVEIPMYKGLNKKRHLRCRISFDLYFQELYDFELSFLSWRLTDVPSFAELLYKATEALSRVRPSNSATGGKGKQRTRMWSNMSFSLIDKLSYYLIRRRLERDCAKETAMMRNISYKTEGSEEDNNTNTLDLYKLILQGQNDLVSKDNTNPNLKNSLPSLKLQIHIRTDSTYRYVTSLSLSSLVYRNTKNAYWENMGEVIFRGTLLDLERADIEIDVIDTTAPKAVNKVGRVVLPLAGIVDYPYLKSKLCKPKWLGLKANMEGWGSAIDSFNFGSLSGKINILRQPRYRQLTTPSGLTLYSHPMMLVVTIGGVDQLIVDDDTAEIDAYVEVSFARMTYRTYVCRNNLAPTWNEDILLPFLTNDAEKISALMLLQRSPIRFTVWGTSNRDGKVLYLGGAVLYLHEIFYTAKGSLKPRVKKTYNDKGGHGSIYDSRVFDTRVFSGPLKLSFLNNEDHQSSLTVSAWIHPSIPDEVMPEQFDAKLVNSVKSRVLPPQMASVYPRLVDDWKKVVELKVKSVFKNAGSVCVEGLTQYQQQVYLPCLIAPMHPPIGIDTPNAIFHMVRCIPFIRKTCDYRFTPDFLMKIKGGDAFDHCILQCSYLRGLIPPAEAFICVGSTQDGRNHTWVVTFMPHINGSVKFWETTTGEIRVLKNRLVNDDCAQDSIAERRLKLKTNYKMPYKTLLYMFNERNVWLNVQGFSDPQLLLYDIDNTDLWYPFSPFTQNAEPPTVPKISYVRVNEYDLQRISSEMQQNIERHITTHRYAQNLQTRWNKDEALNDFLVTGLKLLHQVNTCPDVDIQLAKCELQEWKMLLNKNIPQSHQVVVVPLHFNTVEAEYISDHIKTNIPLLDSRERLITFAFASKVISLPGNLFSVYVILLVAQKIHERVRIRLVMEQERLAQRKRMKKHATSLEEDSNEVENREDSLNESLKAALETNLEMSGDSWGINRQYSSLVEIIDNNLAYQDNQLTQLMSRSLSKVVPLYEKESPRNRDPDKPLSEIDKSVIKSPTPEAEHDSGEKKSSEQPMMINFSNIQDSAPATSSLLSLRNNTESQEELASLVSSESKGLVADLMSTSSYDLRSVPSQGDTLVLDPRSSRGTSGFGTDSITNSNLISSRSCTATGSFTSQVLSGGMSFEMSDTDDVTTRFNKHVTSDRTNSLRMVSRVIASRSVNGASGESLYSELASSNSGHAETPMDYGGSAIVSDTSRDEGLAYLSSNVYLQSNVVSRRFSSRFQQDTRSTNNSLHSNLTDDASASQHPYGDTEEINTNLISHDNSIISTTESDNDADLKSSIHNTTEEPYTDTWRSEHSSVPTEEDDQITNRNLLSDSDGASLLSSGRLTKSFLISQTPSINEGLVSRSITNTSYLVTNSTCSAFSQVADPPELRSERSSTISSSFASDDDAKELQQPQQIQRKATLKTIGGVRPGAHHPVPSARPRRETPAKPKRVLPPQIDNCEAFQALQHGASMSSTDALGFRGMSSSYMDSSRRVSFAETATLYATNKNVTQVTSVDTNTPNHHLARFLFDKSNVKSDDRAKPTEKHRSVCDFQYVDLFRGFLD